MRHPTAPILLLVIVCAISLAARGAWLGQPCRSPCRTADAHVLVFDEQYYVNAARVIAGIPPPPGATYAGAPLGDDPNSEHPQLAKLMIAGAIELLGDQPIAWRFGSLLMGTVAIVGVYALARAVDANRRLALGATTLMASDNLMIVHGRIGTLDIYVLAAMIWAAVLYLRGRVLAAGIMIGIGACFKLVAPSVLLVLALAELAGLVRQRHGADGSRVSLVDRAGARLAACGATAAATFLALLALLDRLAPPYDFSAGRPLAAGPLHHLSHMISFGAHQTTQHGATGIASYPWEWLIDLKPIVYLNINPAQPSAGLRGIHPAAHFLGVISPPILLLAMPALLLEAWRAWGDRGSRAVDRRSRAGELPADGSSRVAILGLAWFAGTFLPFVAFSLIWSRTSYLYYMVVVMPGVYLAVADLVYRHRTRQKFVIAWAFAVIAAALLMYPFTPLP